MDYFPQIRAGGRNIVRHVPAEEVASLQEAIAGYMLLRTLAEKYADEIIRRTRPKRVKRKKENPLGQKRNPTIPQY